MQQHTRQYFLLQTLTLVLLLAAPAVANPLAEPVVELSLAEEVNAPLSLRSQQSTVIGLGGLWPKGLGLYAQHQFLPRLALGLHLGYSLFYLNLGAYGRWYLSEDPGSWYLEALATKTFGGGFVYSPPGHFSLNGLFGWEQRLDNLSMHAGVGLG
ncbi:MAG: hypothetical protein CVV27_18530, partial [Candidatus Melainabacteria bacterium HGW-Melainabacteria-1]